MGAAERSAALLFWRRVRMTRGRRTAARNMGRRTGLHHMAEASVAGLVAGIGAAIAIGAMEWFSRASHYPLVIIPFAPSIVLVIGSPEAAPAQPRALIGGHLVSTITGLALLKLTRPHPWAAAARGGLGVISVDLTRTFPPPAGINPPLLGSNNLPWSLLL